MFADQIPKSSKQRMQMQPLDEVEVTEIPDHQNFMENYNSDMNQENYKKYDSMTDKQQAISYAQMYGTD